MADTPNLSPKNIDDILADAANILNRAQANCALSPRSNNYPYYRPHFAEQVLETIDQVITRRTSVIWPASGISVNALDAKWKQATLYIKENHEPDDIGKLDFVTVTKQKNVGLRIAPRPAAMLALADNTIDWKSEFLSFLETSNPGDNFDKVGILVTSEDKRWVLDILNPMITEYVTDIRADKILVVRI